MQKEPKSELYLLKQAIKKISKELMITRMKMVTEIRIQMKIISQLTPKYPTMLVISIKMEIC